MKKLVIPILLLLSSFSFAAKKPNPADYTIFVHVSASSRDLIGQNCSLYATINGKQYQFATSCQRVDGYPMILALGDYKAKLAIDEHPTSYQSYQMYEVLLPNDKTMKLYVVGLTE